MPPPLSTSALSWDHDSPSPVVRASGRTGRSAAKGPSRSFGGRPRSLRRRRCGRRPRRRQTAAPACKRSKTRKLFGMAVDWPRLGLAVDPHVGDLGEPPESHFVEVLQAAKGPAAEQTRFDIGERSFDLPLRLRPPGSTGHGRAKAVVGRERQEAWVVDRVVAIVSATRRLSCCHRRALSSATPPEVLEGADVLCGRSWRNPGLEQKCEILAAASIAEHVAVEGMDPAAAFVAEVEIIRGVIHLTLLPGGMVSNRALSGRTVGVGRKAKHAVLERTVTPVATKPGAISRRIRRTEMSRITRLWRQVWRSFVRTRRACCRVSFRPRHARGRSDAACLARLDRASPCTPWCVG